MYQEELFRVDDKPKWTTNKLTRSRKRRGFTQLETRVIELRKKLIPISQMMGKYGVNMTNGQIQGVLRRRWGALQDPFNLAVIEQVRTGKSIREVARSFGVNQGCVHRACGYFGIESRKAEERKIKRKARDNEQFAKDLYCYYLDGMGCKEIGVDQGYRGEAEIVKAFTRYIPGYKEKSLERRSKSKSVAAEKLRKKQSELFTNEMDFQKKCAMELDDFLVELNVKDQAHMEIDVLVKTEKADFLIECKVTGRKVDEARALGQALITRATYHNPFGKAVYSMLCFPSDVLISGGLLNDNALSGVMVCNENTIKNNMLGVLRG